jgi:hypothetical protein
MRQHALVAGAMLLFAATAVRAQTPPPSPPATQTTGQAAQAAPAPTQMPSPPQAPAGRRGGQGQTIKGVENALDDLELLQAQANLGLSDSQYAAFFPKMSALLHLRQQHSAQRQALIVRLRSLTNPKPGTPPTDEATLALRVKELDDLELAMAQREHDALADVDSVLNVHQRAQLRVFEENIEQKKVQMLAKVLGGGGGGNNFR